MVKPENALAAVQCYGLRVRGPGTYLAPFGEWWFGILKMSAYNDGMRVNWRTVGYRDQQTIRRLWNAQRDGDPRRAEMYIFDVGSKLTHKVEVDNPHKYRIVSPLPQHVKDSFRHYRQMSSLYGCRRPEIAPVYDKRMATIRYQLQQLRHRCNKLKF